MKRNYFYQILWTALIGSYLTSGQAATVTLDGTIVSKLSDAVNQAQLADDGPHVINITTNTIVNDTQVFITEPMTINGDANDDGIPCDILVDIPGIQGQSSLTPASEKAYLAIQVAGNVTVKSLKIHPNTDGVEATDDVSLRVDGARMLKSDSAGTYVLSKVNFSGSDSSDNYIPLDSGTDLYSTTAKKWSSGRGETSGGNAHTAHAVIQFSNQGGTGSYAVTLDHCHVGLGKSAALNSPATGAGQRVIQGGVYGHCGTDGIRISGGGFRILGTSTDRVRVLRSTNISGGDAHAIEVDGGTLAKMEYVDIACFNTANAIKINGNGAKINDASYIRILGKFNDGNNATVYLNGGNGTSDIKMSNSTVIGYGNNNNPFQSNTNYNGTASFTDTIFTSIGFGRLIVDKAGASSFVPIFTKCALPTDATEFESLTTTGSIFGGSVADSITPDAIAVSPFYMLTLDDYDWSDNQGAGQPGNGLGNINVLRPSNTAYASAGSGNSALTGGAGPAPASIAREVWMLME